MLPRGSNHCPGLKPEEQSDLVVLLLCGQAWNPQVTVRPILPIENNSEACHERFSVSTLVAFKYAKPPALAV